LYRDFHYWVSAILGILLIPLLTRLHLPVNFDWARLISAFWLVLAAQSIFVATLLFLVGFSPGQTWVPLIERFRSEKLRVAVLLTFVLILLWKLTWVQALILTVDTVAPIELWVRLRNKDRQIGIAAILVSALYLFAGFLLIFAYNDIILSVRFFGSYDSTFNGIDKWLLHGNSVSQLSNWATRVFPTSFFHFLEFIYFGMFAQIGAALILSSLSYGKKEGLKFVGTILTAYYLALALFYLWPSQGPYYLSPTNFSQLHSTLQTYAIQKQSIANSQALWDHAKLARISTDYYIAFPCMHIAQPLIVIWFLRRWKWMVAVLAAYDLLLITAILLLQWHYVVDIFAGGLVAALAIAAVDGQALLAYLTRKGIANVGASRGLVPS
jgi:PAP2 superfamily